MSRGLGVVYKRHAFSKFDYGKGHAEALVLFVIVAIISIIQVTVSKKGEVQA